jgi:hypothetical protein
MARTADPNKEELKNIKVPESTHAKLSIIATALNKSIGELIEDILEKAYPEINREAGKALNQMRSLKEKSDDNSK